jgi:hypothetical protein
MHTTADTMAAIVFLVMQVDCLAHGRTLQSRDE